MSWSCQSFYGEVTCIVSNIVQAGGIMTSGSRARLGHCFAGFLGVIASFREGFEGDRARKSLPDSSVQSLFFFLLLQTTDDILNVLYKDAFPASEHDACSCSSMRQSAQW